LIPYAAGKLVSWFVFVACPPSVDERGGAGLRMFECQFVVLVRGGDPHRRSHARVGPCARGIAWACGVVILLKEPQAG